MTVLDELLLRPPRGYEILKEHMDEELRQHGINVGTLAKAEFKHAVKTGEIPPRWDRSHKPSFMSIITECYNKRDKPKRQREVADRAKRRDERSKVECFAYHDVIDSPGEVVALTSSKRLFVNRADVLRDPKQRPCYQHPGLRVF